MDAVQITPVVAQLYAFLIYYRFIFGVFQLACYFTYPTLRKTCTSTSQETKNAPTVSIVCATINDGTKLKDALISWLLGNPCEIWIVTDESSFESVKANIATVQSSAINVIKCSRRNKRAQLCVGFENCTGDVIVVADDDTYWSPVVLSRLTEPFMHEPALGAVFPEVKFRPARRHFNLWETLSASRLAGDCIDIRTTMTVDGGVFCASGTTAAYRTALLLDPDFLDWFPNETWMGHKLNAGDDQSLTLWLCKHNWKSQVIPDEGPQGFCVSTTPRTDWRHLGQLVRWSRSDWQACLISSFMSTSVWRNHTFTAFTRVSWCVGSFTFLIELAYFVLRPRSDNLLIDLALLQLSRIIRFSPEFRKSPRLILYLPAIVIYIYICQIMRVYALLSINNPLDSQILAICLSQRDLHLTGIQNE